jgi:hypothetical protein
VASVVEILARLKADSSQFITEMAKANQATQSLEKSATKTSGILQNKLRVGLFAAGAAAGAFALKLGRDSVAAAMEAGAAHDRLARLLYTTNGATEEGVKILNQQAKALEALTVVTESNITTVQSQLATFDLHGSTIAQLTPAILDYVVAEKGAAASADQYRQMTNGLAQALNGQFASLTAVGFVLDDETKKMIKSGTESERAAAIVDVLNSTYKDFAKTAGETAAGASQKLSVSIGNLKQDFGTALLPTMQAVRSYMATSLVPALQTLQERFGNKESIEKFMKFMGGLLTSVKDFAVGLGTVLLPIFTNVFIPALKVAVAVIIGFIKVLGKIGNFLKKYAIFFTVLATAILTYITVTKLAVLATVGFGKAMLIVKKAQQAYAFWTYTTTGATVGFAGAMNLLKTAFLTNPIGIIIAALIAIGVGFKMAWEKSETFRKVVVGAIQFVVRTAAKGLRLLGKLPGGMGDFFDKSADSMEAFADKLEKTKTITKKTTDKIKDDAIQMPDLSKLGSPTGGARKDEKAEKAAAAAAKKLAEMQQNLKEAVRNYNDYLKFDFAESFMKGADSARDAVMGSLDKLEAVFEAKGKLLGGAGLEKVRNSFRKLSDDVRVSMEEYAKVAGDIEKVVDDLKEAESKLEDALKERANAMEKFGDLLRTPFGEQSAIDKALRDSEASVDSIIGMYDTLVEAVNQRFTGMESGAKSLIVDYLTDQTAALVKLVKRRSAAVDALKDAEEDLKQVLETQAKFQDQLTGGVKDFAKALITLSDADTKAVLTVTKTASGLVINQVKKASTGVDSIVGQLTTRLKQVVTFGKNIEKLLAAGLNREYIQQLLEAGPSAASETAALLTTASADQIAQINSLYTQINTEATSFGTQMSKTFYDNSVAMAKAFVSGAAAEVASINAQMTTITTGIKTIMGVLGNTGLTSAQLLIDGLIAGFGEVNKALVGTAATGVKESVTKALESLKTLGTSLATDLAQGLFDKLTSEKARLVALAQSIAAAIAAAMASATANIGVVVDGAADAIDNLNEATAAAAAAAKAATGGGSGAGGGGGGGSGGGSKATDGKLKGGGYELRYGPMGESLVPGSAAYAKGSTTRPDFSKFAPKVTLPNLSKVVGTTATSKMPPVIIKPTVVAPPKPTYMSNAGTPVNKQGVPQVNKPNVSVNITAPKVAATVTSSTISSAISKAMNSRRG